MDGQLIDVEYEHNCVRIVRVEEDTPGHLVVTPLIETSGGLFRFSKHSHPVPKESVAGFYDTKNLEDTGLFTKIDDVFYESVETSDSDYTSESDSGSDTEVSLEVE